MSACVRHLPGPFTPAKTQNLPSSLIAALAKSGHPFIPTLPARHPTRPDGPRAVPVAHERDSLHWIRRCLGPVLTDAGFAIVRTDSLETCPTSTGLTYRPAAGSSARLDHSGYQPQTTPCSQPR